MNILAHPYVSVVLGGVLIQIGTAVAMTDFWFGAVINVIGWAVLFRLGDEVKRGSA